MIGLGNPYSLSFKQQPIYMSREEGKRAFLFLADNWLLVAIILLLEVSRLIAFILTSIKVKR